MGVGWSTYAAGGSDSHCYLSQAVAFASGSPELEEPLARVANWPSAERALAPAGFVPSPVRRGASVPICPAGLSLLMAPVVHFEIGDRSAAFLVVPFLGAIAVWLTFQLGTALSTPLVGALAAALLACSPIFWTSSSSR